MKKRWLGVGIAVIVVVILLLVTFFSYEREPAVFKSSTPEDTLVFGLNIEPRGIDPATETDLYSAWLILNVYDGLVKYKPGTLEIEPCLAESWDLSGNRKVYTFHLREGVKFHDGTPFTAEAVKYSLDRAINMKLGLSWILGDVIEEIDVLDEHTVQITLKYPHPPFLGCLAHHVGAIVNPKAVEEHGGIKPGELNEWMSKNDVGTGPFKLDHWTPATEIVLVANENYWNGPPKLKKVNFRIIPEASNLKMMLEKGKIDIASGRGGGLDIKDFPTVEENPNLNIIRGPGLSVFFIGTNCQIEPFNDVRVRKAINYAINYSSIIHDVWYGYATRSAGPIPKAMTGHADDVFVFPYDPGKAKELLKEAGYENGFETTLYFPMDPIVMREVTIVQENLKDVGIKVNVRQLAWPTYLDMTEKEGKCPMFASGWIADYNDPAAFMAPLYHSRNWGPGGNIAFYKNEVVDKLLDEIMITADPEERTELCKEAQKIIAEDTPYAFTFTREELHCAGVWVKDFVAQPLGLIDLHPVYKE